MIPDPRPTGTIHPDTMCSFRSLVFLEKSPRDSICTLLGLFRRCKFLRKIRPGGTRSWRCIRQFGYQGYGLRGSICSLLLFRLAATCYVRSNLHLQIDTAREGIWYNFV